MISFIVDGFDPWQRLRGLLDAIARERPQDYEIILVASNLLDTPPEVCQAYGLELFGDRFRLVRNDDMSILAARIRAQEQARGDMLMYLSPLGVPGAGFLEKISAAFAAKPDAAFAAPALTYLYPEGSEERILSHGYAVAPGGRLTPFMLAFPWEKNPADFQVQFVHSYCFISKGPFYSRCDKRQNFWASHLAACERNKGRGLSAGGVACRLNGEDFPLYYRVSENAESSAMVDLWELAAASGRRVEMTPYNSFVLASPADKDAPRDAEAIFWGLLSSQNLALAASAAAGPPHVSLRRVAQHILYLGAITTFKHACERARTLLPENGHLCQTYEEWLDKWGPQADLVYARPDPGILDCLTGSRDPLVAMRNFLHIMGCGLFGLGRRGRR